MYHYYDYLRRGSSNSIGCVYHVLFLFLVDVVGVRDHDLDCWSGIVVDMVGIDFDVDLDIVGSVEVVEVVETGGHC